MAKPSARTGIDLLMPAAALNWEEPLVLPTQDRPVCVWKRMPRSQGLPFCDMMSPPVGTLAVNLAPLLARLVARSTRALTATSRGATVAPAATASRKCTSTACH